MTAKSGRGKARGAATVLLAGGTGTVGREVVKGLVARGLVPRVLSRDPEGARRRLSPSVDIVRGDLAHPASLAEALQGVDVAYLATAPGPNLAAHEGQFEVGARTTEKRVLGRREWGQTGGNLSFP